MADDLIGIAGFIALLALLGIAAARFGFDSRHTRDDRTNHRSLP
jgi:hypothetical protein